MTSNDRPLEDKSAPAGEDQDLAELVVDAVKALSIGGSFGTDGEVRRAVDRLKRLDVEP